MVRLHRKLRLNHEFGPWLLVVFGPAIVSLLAGCTAPRMEFVKVALDNKGFILTLSNKPFIPWGHNYGVNETAENNKMDWRRISRDVDDFRKRRTNVRRIH